MGDKWIKTKVVLKHEFEANWNKSNYVPLFGEEVIYDAEVESKNEKGETILPVLPCQNGTGDRSLPYKKNRIKIGDGIRMVKDLPFVYGWEENVAAIGENSAAFGVSEAKYAEDGTVKTEVVVVRGYNPTTGQLITKKYGTSGAGSGSTGDLTPEEEPNADSVMYYKDGNQILSNFSIEFQSTGAIGENSLTSGEHTLAAAKNARAGGWNTYAGANYSSTDGSDNIAIGEDSSAEGLKNASIGQATHTEGMRNTAEGKNSHLEGLKNHTSTNAVNSHVEGSYNNCRSSNTHIEGTNNATIGSAAHAHVEGEDNITDAINSHLEGSSNTVSGSYKDSEGKTRYSENVHIEGNGNTATTSSATQVAKNAHLEGQSNTVTAENAHVEGQGNVVGGKNGHGEGSNNTIGTSAESAHVGGTNSVANGANAFVHGNHAKVFSANGIAIGLNQYSRENGSISLGHSVQFVEDILTATNDGSKLYSAFTNITDPEQRFSAAVGRGSISIGTNNVSYRGLSLGFDNYSAGDNKNFAVAIGSDNIAKAKNAVAIGKGNYTTVENQQVYGVYNKTNTNAIYIVGHGTEASPLNAFIIDNSNNGHYKGSLYVNADTAGNGGKKVATEEYVDDYMTIISEDYIRQLFA